MNIVDRKLVDLKMDERNPRYNEDAVPKVKESIRKYKYKVPIVIRSDDTIVAGHTRYKALWQINRETGEYETIQCVLADDLTDEELDEFMVADNLVATNATWDFTKLEIILSDLPNFNLDEFGEIKGFRDEVVIADEQLEEPEIPQGKTRIQIGNEKYDWDESSYHAWCSYIIDEYNMSPMDFIIQRLMINEADRTYRERTGEF